jgi:chromosome segregation ATPase
MDNREMKELVDSFKAYRDLLVPIQKNLNDFVGTYDTMRENVDKLNAAFEGDVKGRLEEIFKQLSDQASKTAALSTRIEELADSANKYAQEMHNLVSVFAKIEERLKAVNVLEKQAESQISRLDNVIDEKTKSYNIKELQHALDRYNNDVGKVSEFINKDVVAVLIGSKNQLDSMKGGIDSIVKKQSDENTTLAQLLESYKATGDFLKKITEKTDVNEAYLFEVLDRWAESRRVKTKH